MAMHTIVLETHSPFKLDWQSQIQTPNLKLYFLSEFISDYETKLGSNEQVVSKKQDKRAMQLKKFANNRSYKRNLRYAFRILNIVKYKLLLPDEVIEKSASYYKRTLEWNIIKGRSIGAFAVASVYVACRELRIPKQLREIANAGNVHPVIAHKCYRIILRHLDLNPPSIDCEVYLSQIAKDLLVNEKSYQRSLEILERVKQNFISYGKDPNALATAVLYVACLKEGERMIQSRFAAAGNISIVTLRKRAADVAKVIS